MKCQSLVNWTFKAKSDLCLEGSIKNWMHRSFPRLCIVQDTDVSRTGRRRFCYLDVVHLCFLGKDGGPVNAVEAGGQHSDDEEVEDDADQVDAALLLAGAFGNFLFDPLLLQVCLQRPENGKTVTNDEAPQRTSKTTSRCQLAAAVQRRRTDPQLVQ